MSHAVIDYSFCPAWGVTSVWNLLENIATRNKKLAYSLILMLFEHYWWRPEKKTQKTFNCHISKAPVTQYFCLQNTGRGHFNTMLQMGKHRTCLHLITADNTDTKCCTVCQMKQRKSDVLNNESRLDWLASDSNFRPALTVTSKGQQKIMCTYACDCVAL